MGDTCFPLYPAREDWRQANAQAARGIAVSRPRSSLTTNRPSTLDPQIRLNRAVGLSWKNSQRQRPRERYGVPPTVIRTPSVARIEKCSGRKKALAPSPPTQAMPRSCRQNRATRFSIGQHRRLKRRNYGWKFVRVDALLSIRIDRSGYVEVRCPRLNR
jgi:hypothetical protein